MEVTASHTANQAYVIGTLFYVLFGPLKRRLAGKLSAVQSVTSRLASNFFYARIHVCVPLWNKCLHVTDNCVEVRCVPSSIHVGVYIEARIKLLASKYL
jgi:hypothetical protein